MDRISLMKLKLGVFIILLILGYFGWGFGLLNFTVEIRNISGLALFLTILFSYMIADLVTLIFEFVKK